MTKAELLEQIKNLSDDMRIFVAPRKTEEQYGLVNSAYVKVIEVTDDEYNGVNDEVVLILDEE